MRSNAMKNCALGAMLFGGTLGVAQAGVTGVAGNSSSAILSLASNSETYEDFGTYGSPMAGPVSFSDPTYGWISLSQFTGSGFSLSIGSTALANNQSFFVQQKFIVTDAVNFSLAGYLPASSSRAYISQGSGVNTVFLADAVAVGAFSMTGTLQAGEYSFAYWSSASGAESGTLFNLSFTAVPAPGAAALLGMAGLVGGRRRRA
jgi:hypothetical protein